jgi:hypothetical protein
MKAKQQSNRWSKIITEESHALDLEEGVFTWKNPKKIAQSLKNSSDVSKNRKGTSLQSAMSMLNFFINRAGTKLPNSQKKILEKAKTELRNLYH